MSLFIRCDNCPAEVAVTPCMLGDGVAGWVHLRTGGGSGSGSDGLQFHSWKCLAEYATAKVMIDSATDEGPA